MGDSFCFHRDQETDWPVKLAQLLNLKLTGSGHQGQSWWFIRDKFIEYVSSEEFNNTELFVFCHTEQNRIIGTSNTIEHDEWEPNASIVKIYLMYLENRQFTDWCCEQWFKELNTLLHNKKVIHIQNFNLTKPFFNVLDGVRFDSPSLMDISVKCAGSIDKFLYDTRRNHFENDMNISLAEKLVLIYNKFKDHWPKSVTEKMDI